jgi:hypothetical protein
VNIYIQQLPSGANRTVTAAPYFRRRSFLQEVTAVVANQFLSSGRLEDEAAVLVYRQYMFFCQF